MRTLMHAAFAAGMATVSPVWAHITAQPDEGPAGNYFQTAFVVPHGCNGAPTVAVRIRIPNGVLSVKPQMKPGRDVTTRKIKLQTPVDLGHGLKVSEAVEEVAWRGGPLPDDFYDTFGLIMKLPDSNEPTRYFPVVQECKDSVHRWIEIPREGQRLDDLSGPAPFIRLKRETP